MDGVVEKFGPLNERQDRIAEYRARGLTTVRHVAPHQGDENQAQGGCLLTALPFLPGRRGSMSVAICWVRL